MRSAAPTPQEFADHVSKAVFKPEYRIGFTPVDISKLKSMHDVEKGIILGQIESATAMGKLPAGRTDIFIAKVGHGWHAWGHVNGQVVEDIVQLSVEPEGQESHVPAPAPHPEVFCHTFKVTILGHAVKIKVCLWIEF